jgi:uncharacterized protein YbaR (Trm112 family)
MALNAKLLEVLACPKDKGSLLYFADESSLYNPRQRLRYQVTDDIPNLLAEVAERVDEAEDRRLQSKAANARHTSKKHPAGKRKNPDEKGNVKGKKSSHKKKAVTRPKSKHS